MALQRVSHDLPAAPVGAVQPADQRIVMAERQEQRGRALVVVGRMAHHQAAQRAGLRHQFLRRHEEAKAQAGEQRLGQRADIDHAAIVIERFQGGAGLVHIVCLELVIILDDDDVMLGGPLEDFHAPFQRHGDGRRKLVAGCGEDDVAGIEGVGRHQSLFIDRQQRDMRRAQVEDVAHVRIAWLLHAGPRLGPNQQGGQEIERVLRAERDEDLIVIRHDAAARQDAAADLLHQQRVIMRPRVIGPGAEPLLAQRLPGAIAPFGEREEIVVHLAVDERKGIGLPVQRL